MTYLIITIIIMAVLGVLIFFSRLSIKEKEQKQLALKAKRMLARSEETWEIIEDTSNYIDSVDVFDALLAYYHAQIKEIDLIVSPNDTPKYLEKITTFKANLTNITIKQELKSDTEIKQAKHTLGQASKLLRATLNRKIISNQTCLEMRNVLRKKILDFEVDIHEKLGDKAGEKSNPAVATNHYKYAKKLLIESDLKFEGKNERVREITKKTQILFGNIVADQLSKGVDDEEETHDEFGIPKDISAMAGDKKNF